MINESNIDNRIRKNFSMIPNELINDNSISDRARFLYCFLVAKPDTWKFYNKNLAKDLGYSIDTLRKYMNELIESGWVEKIEHKFDANTYIFYEFKQGETTNLNVSEKTRHGESDTHSNTVLNTSNTNNTNINNISIAKTKTKVSEELQIEAQKFTDWFIKNRKNDLGKKYDNKDKSNNAYIQLRTKHKLSKSEIKELCEFAFDYEFWFKYLLVAHSLLKKSKDGVYYYDLIRNNMKKPEPQYQEYR